MNSNSNRLTVLWRLAITITVFTLFILSMPRDRVHAQENWLSIGTIQGTGDASPFRGDRVNFRGVVTGIQEDQNARGIIYYTLFVQDAPGSEDGDPSTSDGIAVFFGRDRPQMPIGAVVQVNGEVTEFYGFTEIDDDDLRVTVERIDGVVPEAIAIDPPADLVEQHAYFEPLEGMRVTLGGPARVTGATHSGCGLAVVAATDPAGPILRQRLDDPTGRVIPVLYPTDVDCRDMPQVKTGDIIDGLDGVLIYNFDEFKILPSDWEGLTIEPAEFAPLVPIPEPVGEQLSAVTINVNDWFDSVSLTGNPDEPVLSPEALAAKETKLAHALIELLHCPTLVAIQEVEHASLLENLATTLAADCGFTYTVSHVESADARGIDNALLSDPRRVIVESASPQQVCSPVPTDHQDDTIDCEIGTYVLFDRPPVRVNMTIDGRPVVAFVNHFKSKREGEAETALERLAQARFQNALAADLLAANPDLPVLVLGDLNDYELSAPLLALTDPDQGGTLRNVLSAVPESDRYSYVFGGVANLLDVILVSSALSETIDEAGILHLNADYPVAWTGETEGELLPYRFSDHDLPWIIWQHGWPSLPTATAPSTTTAEPMAIEVPVTPTAEPMASAVPASVAQVEAATPAPTIATVAPASEPAMWPWVGGALAVAAVAGLVALLLRRHK